MAWHAKPSGGYSLTSTDAQDNIYEVYWQLSGSFGYTKETVSGILGNVQAESGFNPWRWQYDRVNTHNGYGLFQFTPATGYIYQSGATPNMSVTEVTAGATPEDGATQVNAFATNDPPKWVPSAWRSYWSTQTYSSLYAKRQNWLNIWGNGSSISLSQFKVITDIEAATFFFLACFEGPQIPSQDLRYSNALRVYQILGGVPPTPPTPPDPPVPPFYRLKYWLLKAMKNARDNKRSADI